MLQVRLRMTRRSFLVGHAPLAATLVIDEADRSASPRDLFWPWFAANVSVFGISYGSAQCAQLLSAGAPGIHFYALNRWPATRAILERTESLSLDTGRSVVAGWLPGDVGPLGGRL